jgi:hypothetical protein
LVSITVESDSIQIPPLNNVELNSQNQLVELNQPEKRDKPWLFAPGQSGNPAGKPAGTKNSVQLGGPITQETLDKLETFSKPELIKLIKKVSGAVWGIGIMNDDEAFEAVRLKLLHTGLTSESANSSLNVLKEWADRTKGKAPQSIAMKIDADPLSKLSADRLLALEKTLAKVTGQEAMIIPPMPELLPDSE